jgi:hypothetical protein
MIVYLPKVFYSLNGRAAEDGEAQQEEQNMSAADDSGKYHSRSFLFGVQSLLMRATIAGFHVCLIAPQVLHG